MLKAKVSRCLLLVQSLIIALCCEATSAEYVESNDSEGCAHAVTNNDALLQLNGGTLGGADCTDPVTKNDALLQLSGGMLGDADLTRGALARDSGQDTSVVTRETALTPSTACADTDSGTNIHGQNCASLTRLFYNGPLKGMDTSVCRAFKNKVFNAMDMCCVCGGGAVGGKSLAQVDLEKPRSQKSQKSNECADTDNGARVHGQTCATIKNLYMNGPLKGFARATCKAFHDNDFDALEMCCVCGGGSAGGTSLAQADLSLAVEKASSRSSQNLEGCKDKDDGARPHGWTCAKITQLYTTGPLKGMPPATCRAFHDNEFDAFDLCCVCGGGKTRNLAILAQTSETHEVIETNVSSAFKLQQKAASCLNTDNHTPLENKGLSCASVEHMLKSGVPREMCSAFRDGEFDAAKMCCECGGGLTQGDSLAQTERGIEAIEKDFTYSAHCVDQDKGADFNNQTCKSIAEDFSNGTLMGMDTSVCRAFKDDDFDAIQMCCACGGGAVEMCVDQDMGVSAQRQTCESIQNLLGEGVFKDVPISNICSAFHDDDFDGTEMCCACGGGKKIYTSFAQTITAGHSHDVSIEIRHETRGQAAMPSAHCADSDKGATVYGQNCASLARMFFNGPLRGMDTSVCRAFTNKKFNALNMCCVCGGGTLDKNTPLQKRDLANIQSETSTIAGAEIASSPA